MSDLVGLALKFLNRNACLDVHRQPNIMSGTLARFKILNFCGLLRSFAIAPCHGSNASGRARRLEARAHDHRENKFVPPIDIRQAVKVFEIHQNLLARFDVRDPLSENIGPFLFQ